MLFTFVITDNCNLRCPTCPSKHVSTTGQRNYVSLDFCHKVFKHMHELYGPQDGIALYSISEPLLHPNLKEILDLADNYGHKCEISTNLNVQYDLQPIISHRALSKFDICISGLTQDIYARGHCGGSIKLALDNMHKIAQMDKSARVSVKFILYNDNINQLPGIEKLCAQYGFDFNLVPAFIFYYGDTILALAQGQDFPLPEKAKSQVPRLLDAKLTHALPISGLQQVPCFSQTGRVYINFNGMVHTCNYATNKPQGVLEDFLSMDAAALQEAKTNNAFCQACKSQGLHVQWQFFSALLLDQISGADKKLDFSILQHWQKFLSENEFSGAPAEIAIYGAGFVGETMNKFFQGKKINTVAFIDDDAKKQGSTSDGITVYSPADYLTHNSPKLPVVLSMLVAQDKISHIKQQLGQGGVSQIYTFSQFITACTAD